MTGCSGCARRRKLLRAAAKRVFNTVKQPQPVKKSEEFADRMTRRFEAKRK